MFSVCFLQIWYCSVCVVCVCLHACAYVFCGAFVTNTSDVVGSAHIAK